MLTYSSEWFSLVLMCSIDRPQQRFVKIVVALAFVQSAVVKGLYRKSCLMKVLKGQEWCQRTLQPDILQGKSSTSSYSRNQLRYLFKVYVNLYERIYNVSTGFPKSGATAPSAMRPVLVVYARALGRLVCNYMPLSSTTQDWCNWNLLQYVRTESWSIFVLTS